MPENKRQHAAESPKPESAGRPAKRGHDEPTRERASESDRSHADKERGERNPGNFRNDPDRASEAGRKGGQR